MRHSALYVGTVRHRRHQPRRHAFHYRLFMVYLDLAELDEVFQGSWTWSAKWPALAWFRRADFLGDPEVPLADAVRDLVERELRYRPTGPIRLLTNLRYFGKLMNPISCYYCYSESGDRLESIVAEVTNTPWGERRAYVLAADPSRQVQRIDFAKTMHVSPFHPMNQSYRLVSRVPAERLAVHIENRQDGATIFDATLSLRRREITTGSLRRVLLRWPLMSFKVLAAIYWQALRLLCKGVPLYRHPGSRKQQGVSTVS